MPPTFILHAEFRPGAVKRRWPSGSEDLRKAHPLSLEVLGNGPPFLVVLWWGRPLYPERKALAGDRKDGALRERAVAESGRRRFNSALLMNVARGKRVVLTDLCN